MLISWINEWPCSVLPLTLDIERVQLHVQLSHSFMSSTANILAGFSPGRECLLFISSVPTHHLDYFSAPGSLTLSFAASTSSGFSLPLYQPTGRREAHPFSCPLVSSLLWSPWSQCHHHKCLLARDPRAIGCFYWLIMPLCSDRP